MGTMSAENWEKHELAKDNAMINHKAKAKYIARVKADIEKVGLTYRYFRMHNPYNKTSRNHNGVICVGYKVLNSAEKGIKFTFSVSLCVPGDCFSKFKAKEYIIDRYTKGEHISVFIDYGNCNLIDDFIRTLWNGGRLPIEKLGIKAVSQGETVKLKAWMKYIP